MPIRPEDVVIPPIPPGVLRDGKKWLKRVVVQPPQPYQVARPVLNPPKKVDPPEDGSVGKVNALDLGHMMGKPRNRVTLLGVELEGGWKDVHVLPGIDVERDGSVFKVADAGGLRRNGYPDYLCGEIPIGPFLVGQMPAAMKRYWPDVIDQSCGMHVHMSFETLMQYNILTDSPAYQETMMAYLKRWAQSEGFPEKDPIWGRLSGKCVYCQRKFWPMAQMETIKKDHDKERFGHRYTAIHYAWQRTKTVECRLLPMMATVEQGIRAVRQVVDITNAYLVVAEKRRVKDYSSLKMGNGAGQDHMSVEKGNGRIRMILDSGDVYEEFVQVLL